MWKAGGEAERVPNELGTEPWSSPTPAPQGDGGTPKKIVGRAKLGHWACLITIRSLSDKYHLKLGENCAI
jgi:hypothetical protein